MSDLCWLDRLSETIADGDHEGLNAAQRPETLNDADSRQWQAMTEIAGLARLFSRTDSAMATDDPVCPFEWGRLQVIESIGQGSFSNVYRAHDPTLARDVALKLYRTDRADDASLKLIDEARQHAQIHHPRVLAIHGADTEDDVPGFWMDLLSGQTLAEAIIDQGPLDSDRLLGLATDLVNGLAAVHEQQLVHGDLKAANVWLDDQQRALLMDFGAAQHAESEGPARFGTPATMAPELFEGASLSTQSDVYALGALLHHAACGQYPVLGDSLADIRDAHARGEKPLEPPALLALPRPFHRLIKALLKPNPDERPSLSEVHDRLQDIQRAPERRFRRLALVAVVGSLVLGLATSLWFLIESQSAKRAAELELKRNQEVSGYLRAIIEQPQMFRQGRNVTIAEGIEALAPRVDDALKDDPIGRALFLARLGDTTAALGKMELGERWMLEAKNLLEQHGSTSSNGYRYTLRTLAGLEGDALRFDAGIAYLDPAGDGFEWPETLTDDDFLDAAMLANLYAESGQTEQALTLAQQAFTRAQSYPFTDRPDNYLLIVEALARAQDSASQIEASIQTAQQGLDWSRQQALPERHGKTIQLREFLVWNLIQTGQLEAASAQIEHNLSVIEPWLGINDRATARNQNLKSIALVHGGHYEQAAELMEPLLERTRTQNLLPDNQRDGLANNLANAYKEIGRAEDALDIYRWLQRQTAEELGDDHPQYLIISSNIAETLVDMNRYAEAESVARVTLSADQTAFGDAHPYTNHARTMLGAALTGMGQLQDAEDHLRTAQQHMLDAMGPKSTLYVQTSLKLTINLLAQQRHQEAQALAARVIGESAEALGKQHPYLQALRQRTAI